MLEATYTWKYAQQQFVEKLFRCKISLHKIFLYVFCVRKYFYNENKANYGNTIDLKMFVVKIFSWFV